MSEGHATKRQKHQDKLKVIVIGAGARGNLYAGEVQNQYSSIAQIVAVAEPNEHRRKEFARHFNLSSDMVFKDWRDIAAMGTKIADAVFICVQDKLHSEVCLAFAAHKYHILLEKPMAVTLADCHAIHQAVSGSGTVFAIAHVLRYSPINRQLRALIEMGAIGEVKSIQHVEPVGFFHFAHSYVRGNWRNEKESTFSLMAKSCHDIDIISYLMGEECTRVSSFGSLSHFKKEKKPKEAGTATRCTDCRFESNCPYSAKKIYLTPLATAGNKGWPVNVIADVVDIENVTSALKNGPYGRCVYECDNDVVDNQVVNMEFKSGATSSFTMIAFSEEVCVRKTRVYGSLGELTTDGHKVEHYDFLTTKKTIHHPLENPDLTGHGGGDSKLVEAFLKSILSSDQSLVISGSKDSFDSHLLVFASEESRKTGQVVDITEFRKKYGR